jgi:hypothetical protein
MGLFNNHKTFAGNFYDPIGLFGGKKKGGGFSLPKAPEWYTDPTAEKTIPALGEAGLGLSRGDYLDPNSALGFLAPLTQLNPEITQRAFGLAARPVIDAQQDAFTQIRNELAANNQLSSSVASSRLGDLQKGFSRDIADISTRFELADLERAMTNTRDLFQLGLGTLESASSLGLTNQQQRNSFNLTNFENQLGLAVAPNLLAPQTGGISGGLQGGLGGALTGFELGGPVGGLVGFGLGAYTGSQGTQNTGGQLLNAGALAYGLGKRPSFIPGGAATNAISGPGKNLTLESFLALNNQNLFN